MDNECVDEEILQKSAKECMYIYTSPVQGAKKARSEDKLANAEESHSISYSSKGNECMHGQ